MPRKTNDLHLPDLAIRNFRGVRKLDILRLGRVTLLTGQNGVGKTTILEALQIYATAGNFRGLQRILRDRDEVVSERDSQRAIPLNWFSLFHGQRKSRARDLGFLKESKSKSGGLVLTIGPTAKSDWLTLRLGRSSDDMLDRWSSAAERMSDVDLPLSLFAKFRRREREVPVTFLPDRAPWGRGNRFDDPAAETVCRRLGPGIPDGDELARSWDRVALTPQEELVVNTLKLVVRDGPERIALIGSEDERARRRFVVRLAGQDERVPLRSLGDGANRLFSLVLALANVEGGVLLIDEAENGIHHRVHESYWSLIFQFAKQHDVQVVATTHSWDAVNGFARAASDHLDDAGLVRLQRVNGEISAVEYKPEEIHVVARQGIEVR